MMIRFILFAITGLCFLGLARAQNLGDGIPSGEKIALILANSDYEPEIGPLPAARNDAQLMFDALTDIGFETTLASDGDSNEMWDAIELFQLNLASAPPGSLGFIYYSGHGVSLGGGQDYLIGVDIEWNGLTEAKLQAESVSYQSLYDGLSEVGDGKYVVLAMDSQRSLIELPSETRGFVSRSAANMFEIWASRYGDVAVDSVEGTRGTSPFSYAFAEELETPGLDIREIFAGVQNTVVTLTVGEQYPEYRLSSLTPLVLNDADPVLEDPAFDPLEQQTVAPVQQVVVAPDQDQTFELALWNSAMELGTTGALSDFLEKFPDSIFAEQARLRMAALSTRPEPSRPASQIETLLPTIVVPGPKRLALLIGNKGYAPQLRELTNPHNDIDLLSNRLRAAGFEVMLARDADPDNMNKALSEYVIKLADASEDQPPISFFYFSGHGFSPEDAERNFLIPVALPVKKSNDLLRALALEDVIERIEAVDAQFSFFVLDACRNDPGLPPSEDGTKSLDGAKGLSRVSVSGGSLIAYATEPGEVAFDAPDQDIGPYAGALAEALTQPGLDASRVFKYAQRKVFRDSDERQVPWIEDGLMNDFVFVSDEG